MNGGVFRDASGDERTADRREQAFGGSEARRKWSGGSSRGVQPAITPRTPGPEPGAKSRQGIVGANRRGGEKPRGWTETVSLGSGTARSEPGNRSASKWTRIPRDGGGAKWADRRDESGDQTERRKTKRVESGFGMRRTRAHKSRRNGEGGAGWSWRKPGTTGAARSVLAGPAGDGQGQEGSVEAKRRKKGGAATREGACTLRTTKQRCSVSGTGLEDRQKLGSSGSPELCVARKSTTWARTTPHQVPP